MRTTFRRHAVVAALLTLLGVACQTAPVAAAGPRPSPISLEATPAKPQEGVVQPRLVPAPASLVINPGPPFELTRASVIAVDDNVEARAIAEGLAELLRPAIGFPFSVVVAGPDTARGSIRLRLANDRASLGEEGYELVATPSNVRITAYHPTGLFRAVQTLRQLLPTELESEIGVARSTWAFPALTIVDRPRFAWRGAMLDVARHFFSVQEVKQFIDVLALYKVNVLHLGLSNDQGWRIEIKSRPALTAAGAITQVGGGPGGYYSQQDYQDIVRYARARYITIVPEINMPGHTNAALISHPALSCGTRAPAPFTGIEVGWSTFCVENEQTYALVDDIIREMAAITPGAYLHIGGDEVEVLTDAQYAAFVERAQNIVHKYGKRMIGWEEITKAKLAPTTLAQQWKSDSATGALKYGAKLVLSPARKVYIDMKYTPSTELGLNWAGNIEVRDAYEWDPASYLGGVGERDILGVEAPLWSETIRNITAAQYLAMPRLPAIAEVAWSPQSVRRWEDFRIRIAAHAARWNLLGINYYRSPQVPW